MVRGLVSLVAWYIPFFLLAPVKPGSPLAAGFFAFDAGTGLTGRATARARAGDPGVFASAGHGSGSVAAITPAAITSPTAARA
jgi:hypothetical protein